MLYPARFLGIAEDLGNEFAYYIRTEGPKPQILVRSNIRLRRISIRTSNEKVSNNSDDFLFWLDTLIDKQDAIKEKSNASFSSPLPPPPNYPIPDGFPNAVKNISGINNSKVTFAEPIESINMQTIDPNDLANDLLDDFLT